MKRKNFFFSLFLMTFTLVLLSCQNNVTKNDYLIAITDSNTNECGYLNSEGDTIIPFGKYAFFFTDTFKTYAIVYKTDVGFIAIDRKENELYKVFPFDNGPDYPSDGFFRILQANKIGFADINTGEITIKPQFDCAFPFENGRAKVSLECQTESDGEHTRWVSENWYFINLKGEKIVD
jgi:hypothetical protein